MSEWKEYYLSELGALSRGKSKHRPRWSEHLYGGKYPFIQTGEITAVNKYIDKYSQTYSEAGLAQSKLWEKGTLCITIAANIAEIAILKFPACFPDSILGFVPDKEKANLDFTFYTLKHFQSRLKQLAIGSVQDNINVGTFLNIKFGVPSVAEQKQIADVLSCLDAKIENLRRQNETLEAIAQTLFKHWFIDFEFPDADGKPYKSSGGEMVDSAIGDIPEGWRVEKFSSFFALLNGGTPKTSIPEYWGGNIKWLSVKDITQNHNQFILDTEKTITDKGVQKSAAKLLPKYTTVVSARGTVGSYCLLSEEMAISQSIFGVYPKSGSQIFFAHLLMSSLIQILKTQAYGSVFDTVTASTFNELNILIPKLNIIKDFEVKIVSVFDKQLLNKYQIQTLTKIRDALLPKLMSGQLRIEE